MKLTKNLLIALGLLSVVALFGCAPKEEAASEEDAGQETSMVTEEPEAEANEVTSDEQEAADMDIAVFSNESGEAVCPVLGEVVNMEKNAGYQDYEGTRYYFCCAGCPEAFAAEPEKYINKEEK